MFSIQKPQQGTIPVTDMMCECDDFSTLPLPMDQPAGRSLWAKKVRLQKLGPVLRKIRRWKLELQNKLTLSSPISTYYSYQNYNYMHRRIYVSTLRPVYKLASFDMSPTSNTACDYTNQTGKIVSHSVFCGRY